MSFFNELKRRNVIRVGIAYIVSAWLVVEVSTVIFDIYGAPEWLPKVLVSLLLVGLPIALMFSWVYELTPEGIKRESEVAAEQSISGQTGRKLNLITMAVVIAGVAFVAAERFVFPEHGSEADRPATASDEAGEATPVDSGGDRAASLPGGNAADTIPSIAVLPFADMSSAQDQEYFSDGIAEELLNLLAKVPDLKVAARTSSFRFKGKDRDITEIARTLGVNHVLEGSVRKSGDRVRVTAQLIDARDGFHVWSDSYDQELVDILDVQDSISGQIVDALSERLGIALDRKTLPETRSLSSGEAYDFYLRGNFEKHRRTPDSLLSAVANYQQSVALEPDLAPAWGGLARAATLAAEVFLDRTTEFEALRAEATERALSLDPNEPQALGAQAGFLFDDELDFAAGLETYEKVIESDPSDTEAMSWLAQRYRYVGYLDKAETLNRRAYGLDPLSPRVIIGITRTLQTVGKLEESRRIAEKAMVDLNGHDYAVRSLLGYHLMSGDLEGAEELAARLDPRFAFNYYEMHLMLAAARDDHDAIRRLMERAGQDMGEGSAGDLLVGAIGHFLRGELDEAREKRRLAVQLGAEARWWIHRPKLRRAMPEPGRRVYPDFARWIEDFPEVIEAFATLDIDIVAEVEAAEELYR